MFRFLRPFSSGPAKPKPSPKDALAVKIAKAQLKKLPNPLKDIPNGPISGFTLFVKERYESVAKSDGYGGPKKASVDCIKELARIWKNDDSLKSEFQEKAKRKNQTAQQSASSLFSTLSIYDHFILHRRLSLLKKISQRSPFALPDLIYKKKRVSALTLFLKEKLSYSVEELASFLGVGVGNVGSMTAADKMKGVVAKFVALRDAEKQVYKEKAESLGKAFDEFLAAQDQQLIKKAEEEIEAVRKQVTKDLVDPAKKREIAALSRKKKAAASLLKKKRAVAAKKKIAAAKKKAVKSAAAKKTFKKPVKKPAAGKKKKV